MAGIENRKTRLANSPVPDGATRPGWTSGRSGLLNLLAPLLLVSGLSAISLGVFSVAIPLYALSLGASPGEWGLMASVAVASLLIFEPLWGILSDRIGIRLLLISTRFALAATSVFFLSEPGLSALYVLQFARASFEAPIWPLAKAYIGTEVHPAAKGTCLGLFFGCLGIGQAIGAAVTGFAISGSGFQLAFFLCVVFSLVAGSASFVLRRQPKAKTHLSSPPWRADRVGSSAAAPSSYIWPFAVLSFVSIFALAGWSGAQTFLPVVASRSLGLAADQVGILVTIVNLGNAFLMVPAGYLADRKGRKPAIAMGLLICSAAMAGFALASDFWTLLLPVLAFSAGRPAPQAARVALLSDLMPDNRQGLVMGLIGAIEDVGVIMGTAGGGLIWQWLGRESTFAMLMVFQLLGVAVCLAFVKEREWLKRAAPVVS